MTRIGVFESPSFHVDRLLFSFESTPYQTWFFELSSEKTSLTSHYYNGSIDIVMFELYNSDRYL